MREVAVLFWNNVLSRNLIFIQFLGVLLAVVETEGLRTSLKKGYILAKGILISAVLGWIFMAWIPEGSEYIILWVFLTVSLIIIYFIQKSGYLTETWKGMPEFILILVPMIGLQWTVWEQGVDFADKIYMIAGSVAGFYLAFILIAAVKEQIKLSETSMIFKKLPTLLLAIGFFALAVIGFSFL